MTTELTGKNDRYVYQMSNGSQQIKLYEPHKYKNNVKTPLRVRTRMIMHLAYQAPCPDIKKRIQELHFTYPYYLLQDEPVNLRLKNFRFETGVMVDDTLKIYKKISSGEPDPETDMLIDTVDYRLKKSIKFTYNGEDEQYFYAVNTRNNKLSNVLHFIWQNELQQIPEN